MVKFSDKNYIDTFYNLLVCIHIYSFLQRNKYMGYFLMLKGKIL